MRLLRTASFDLETHRSDIVSCSVAVATCFGTLSSYLLRSQNGTYAALWCCRFLPRAFGKSFPHFVALSLAREWHYAQARYRQA
jgi:hypothetical protein